MLSFVVAGAFAAPTHAQMESAAWERYATREHDDAGKVEIFTAQIGGLPCFRASATTADADAGTMLKVVMDVTGAKRWSSAGVTKAEVLSRAGNSMAYYQYLDVPGWTMTSDRFWFLQSVVVDEGTKKKLLWDKLDVTGPYAQRYQQFKAQNPSAVEPPVNVGSWMFESRDFGVDVHYSICTDAGGSIPTAIQSAATRKTLPDTVGDVVREAKKRLGKFP